MIRYVHIVGIRELSRPRLFQSASWQSASWRIRELSSNRQTSAAAVSSGRLGVYPFHQISVTVAVRAWAKEYTTYSMANIFLHHYMPQRTTLSHCHYLRPRKLVSWSLTSLFSTNMAISETIRPRKHNKELISNTRTLNNKEFIVRVLYKDMY